MLIFAGSGQWLSMSPTFRPHGIEIEVVGELEEGPLDAEVGCEREREDEGVGRRVAARVVAHEQDRALGGDLLEPLHVGAEVEAREQPHAGQGLPDVVGIALVEVGGRDALLHLVRHETAERLHGAPALALSQRAIAAPTRGMRSPVSGALLAHKRVLLPSGYPCALAVKQRWRGRRAEARAATWKAGRSGGARDTGWP